MAITSAKQQNMAKTNIGNNTCQTAYIKVSKIKLQDTPNTVTPLGVGNA